MKKGFAFLFIALLAFLVFEVVINRALIYPYNYFEYHQEIENYSIFSDREIDPHQAEILDDVTRRLALVEIHIPERTFEIFFCHEPTLFQTFAELAGKPARSQGMNIQPLYYTFIHAPFIDEIGDEFQNISPYSLLEGDQAHIIAHEIIHELIALEVGFLKTRSLPNWKIEGYAEYFASHLLRQDDAGYNFQSKVKDYYNGKFDYLTTGHFHYIESSIFIEYLISQKKLRFQEIFHSSVIFEDVEGELSKWNAGNL